MSIVTRRRLCACFIALIAVGLRASPYAPMSVSKDSSAVLDYTYTTTGQRLSRGDDQFIQWGLIDKPARIETGNKLEMLAHGPKSQRYLRKHADSSKSFYIGEMEYHIDAGSSQLKGRLYIRNGGYSPVAMVDIVDAKPQYSYLLQDHVGSILIAVDERGSVIAEASQGRYDPWGQPWGADGVASNTLQEKSRGFTGHENIASAALIQMNGRVYDPVIGLFLGPDRFIQKASQMVGLNRYAYISNSPVNGTDPSGWIGVSSLINERNLRAVRGYTSHLFSEFQETARKFPMFSQAEVPHSSGLKLADLDEAIVKINQSQRSAAHEAIKTYKGLTISNRRSKEIMALKNAGDRYRSVDYFSTSWYRDVAKQFAFRDGAEEGIILEVIGNSGAELAGLSDFPWEVEILYGRNTEFSLISRKALNEEGIHYFQLREESVAPDILQQPERIFAKEQNYLKAMHEYFNE